MTLPLEAVRYAEVTKVQWYGQLRSLIAHFPQFYQGNLRYVIEAGVVVNFLFTQRSPPCDIDLLVYDERLIGQMVADSPEWYHAQTVSNWLSSRGIRPTIKGEQYLYEAHTPMFFRGNSYECLWPEVVAAGKTFDYRGCEPRAKDLMDLCLLRVGSAQLEQVANNLQGK